MHYTIGQRRGLGIAAAEPLYVVALDARAARVVVGPRQALETRRVRLRDVNWIGEGAFEDIPARGLAIAARVRSTRPPAAATLLPGGEVEFDEPETGVSPGQACVFYASCDPARARARRRLHCGWEGRGLRGVSMNPDHFGCVMAEKRSNKAMPMQPLADGSAALRHDDRIPTAPSRPSTGRRRLPSRAPRRRFRVPAASAGTGFR